MIDETSIRACAIERKLVLTLRDQTFLVPCLVEHEELEGPGKRHASIAGLRLTQQAAKPRPMMPSATLA